MTFLDRSLTRRTFLGTTALAAVGCATRGRGGSSGTTPARGSTLYVGTYTANTASRGIYRVTLDPATLAAREVTLAAESLNPSYLALAPDGRALVAVNEVTEFGGAPSGAVSAHRRDPVTGVLSAAVAQHPSRGGAPCYVSIDRTGRHVLVANYVGGNVAVLPLGDGAALGAPRTVVAHAGRGPSPRQGGPHAHSIVLDPANRFALSADLGSDRIYVSRFDAASGALTPAAAAEVAVRAGAGPRHLAFSPDGRTLYCANELDATIVAFAYEASTGALTQRHQASTRPEGATGENLVADIHVHPSGRAVYVSNRGDDTLAVFSVAPSTGALALVQSVSTEGNWPRNFALSPDGSFLLVANQRSDSIVAFRVDGASGRLAPAGGRIEVPSPVCLLFD